MNERLNLIIAIAVSFLVMFAWDFFVIKKDKKVRQDNTEIAVSTSEVEVKKKNFKNKDNVLKNSPRVFLENSKIIVSINTNNALVDYADIKGMTKKINDEEKVHPLLPQGTKRETFIKSGFISQDNRFFINDNQKWNVIEKNKKYLKLGINTSFGSFTKEFILDNNNMLTIRDNIAKNNSNSTPYFYALIRKHNPKNLQRNVFEGISVMKGSSVEEYRFQKLKGEEKQVLNVKGKPWIAMNNKYYVVSAFFDFDQDEKSKISSSHTPNGENDDIYQTDLLSKIGDKRTVTTKVYIGAKEYSSLSYYEKKKGITNLTSVIDFGFFFFLTKPLLLLLSFIYNHVANFAIAIIITTIVVRLFMLPLSYKSAVSMGKIKEYQPKFQALKETYGDDKQRYNQELWNLYRKEKINPLAGCFPLLLQIPVFFSMYKVFLVSIEARQASFLWIADMSERDPSSIFNLFGLLPYQTPEVLTIGILPILMGVSMFFQQKVSPQQITDPTQRKIMAMLPLFLAIFLASFPAALMLYWICSNIFSILQQLIINKLVVKK